MCRACMSERAPASCAMCCSSCARCSASPRLLGMLLARPSDSATAPPPPPSRPPPTPPIAPLSPSAPMPCHHAMYNVSSIDQKAYLSAYHVPDPIIGSMRFAQGLSHETCTATPRTIRGFERSTAVQRALGVFEEQAGMSGREMRTSCASGMASGPGRVLPVVMVKWQRPSDARRTLPLPNVKLPRRSGTEPACRTIHCASARCGNDSGVSILSRLRKYMGAERSGRSRTCEFKLGEVRLAAGGGVRAREWRRRGPRMEKGCRKA